MRFSLLRVRNASSGQIDEICIFSPKPGSAPYAHCVFGGGASPVGAFNTQPIHAPPYAAALRTGACAKN